VLRLFEHTPYQLPKLMCECCSRNAGVFCYAHHVKVWWQVSRDTCCCALECSRSVDHIRQHLPISHVSSPRCRRNRGACEIIRRPSVRRFMLLLDTNMNVKVQSSYQKLLLSLKKYRLLVPQGHMTDRRKAALILRRQVCKPS
jgi:hypothetical protein